MVDVLAEQNYQGIAKPKSLIYVRSNNFKCDCYESDLQMQFSGFRARTQKL